jgi:hypothetical protein
MPFSPQSRHSNQSGQALGAFQRSGIAVTDVTYVSYVPTKKRAKLRLALENEDTGTITWFEKKKLFGSEFYFSGPAELVRKTHAYITRWVANDELSFK